MRKQGSIVEYRDARSRTRAQSRWVLAGDAWLGRNGRSGGGGTVACRGGLCGGRDGKLTGGVRGHSIALISDAVHNLTDVPSLAIAWIAMRVAERPANAEKTFGYHRVGTLAAFVNAIILVLISGFLFYEAWERFRNPQPVHVGIMMVISLVALAINGGITLAVVRGRRDLNVRAIFIHNLGDALSNIAILGGALVIRATAAQWLGPLLGGV